MWTEVTCRYTWTVILRCRGTCWASAWVTHSQYCGACHVDSQGCAVHPQEAPVTRPPTSCQGVGDLLHFVNVEEGQAPALVRQPSRRPPVTRPTGCAPILRRGRHRARGGREA